MTDEQAKKLDEVHAMLKSMLAQGGGVAAKSAGKAGQVADDKLFQGQYGNPDIRVEPREWTGASVKGQRFSDAPPEWLDMAAEMFDRFGEKAEKENRVNDKTGKPNAWMDFQKAALARRWAQEKRKEGGSQRKAPTDLFDDTEPPF